MAKINVNRNSHTVDGTPDTPLLWVLRDHLNLTGTKFGCGIAHCGACTVHLDGTPVRARVMLLSSISDKAVTTIEALAEGEEFHPVQQAWIERDVAQCGYCQSGQIMSAVATGEIELVDGRVKQSNFHDYPVLHMPEIDVHIYNSGELASGVGKPLTALIAPAIGNALSAAAGKRIRTLPFSNHGFTLV